MKSKNYLLVVLIAMLWPIGAIAAAVNTNAVIVDLPFDNLDGIGRTID